MIESIEWKLKTDSSLQDNTKLDANLNIEGLPQILEKLLVSRGFINRELVDDFINPDIKSLSDPMLLLNMDKAVTRLLKAFREDEKICIYADFDLDGTSGLALLLTGIKKLGFKNVIGYQPKRLSQGYGFHIEAVDDLLAQGVSLIVTVDVGITAIDTVKYANDKGVDVILTDHHLPSETLPPAFAVVNPNQPECKSELGYLCGAGVAFYLLRALKRAFFETPDLPKNEWDLKDVLEFFTIGTLTDMVPLIKDNRVLVKYGLACMSKTTKPGLRGLLQELGLSNKRLSSQDVAIRFAPKLNALSRMENGILPIEIFLVEDPDKAESMVSQALKSNDLRVKFQKEAEVIANEFLNNWKQKDFVFVCSDKFHKGVIGLIATKLSKELQVPAFVGSINADGVVAGSARVPDTSDICLVEALNSASSLLNRFGGHSSAAGFELNQDQIADVEVLLSKHFAEMKNSNTKKVLYYDLDADIGELNSHLMKWYEHIGPFGTGFVIPILKFKSVLVSNIKQIKGGHFKMSLSDEGSTSALSGVLFNPNHSQLSFMELIKKVSYPRCDILGEIQRNYFGSTSQIQILIKDLKLEGNQF